MSESARLKRRQWAARELERPQLSPLAPRPAGDATLPRLNHADERQASAPMAAKAGHSLHHALATAGPGQQLDPAARAQLEPQFGHSFAAVRVHTDDEADRLARSVDAVAFTTDQEIFFRSGAYDPGSPQGLHLLAHEAAHTIQQAAGPVAGRPIPGGIAISDPSDSFEQAAHRAANAVLASQDRSVTQTDVQAPQAAAHPPAVQAAADGRWQVQRCSGQGHESCACTKEESEAQGAEMPTLTVQRQDELDAGEGEGPQDASLPGGVGTPPPALPEVPWAPPPGIQTVKFWLNAFIPRDVPGVSRPAVGPHSGETMLPGPIPLVSDCVLTDQRDFSSAVHAPSRMHSEAEINVDTPSIAWQWHHCDFTHEVDCEDGEDECTQEGVNRGSYTNLHIVPGSSSLFAIRLQAAAHNPCFTGSPDIEYEGMINVDLSARTVAFDGRIDQFPAYEMYATANDGAGVPVFQTPPPPGNTPGDLVHTGGPNRPQSGKAVI
jgi:hypothetical protein